MQTFETNSTDMKIDDLIKEKRAKLLGFKADLSEYGQTYNSEVMNRISNRCNVLNKEIEALENQKMAAEDISQNVGAGDLAKAILEGSNMYQNSRDYLGGVINDLGRKKLSEVSTNLPENGIAVPLEIMNATLSSGQDASSTQSVYGLQPENTPLGSMGVNFMQVDYYPEFKRVKSRPSTQWLDETEAATQGDATFDRQKADFKRLYVGLDVSGAFLAMLSDQARDRFLATEIMRGAYRAIQQAAINGDGVKEPTGLLNMSGVIKRYAGDAAASTTNADGAAMVLADIHNMEEELADKYDDLSQLGWLTNTKVRKALRSTPIASGSDRYIWGQLFPYNVTTSNIVPNTLSKGAATDLSAMILGDWSQLFIPHLGAMVIQSNPYTLAAQGIIRLHVNLYVDVIAHYEDSFVVIPDIIA